MAEKKHVQHLRSKVVENGKPKLPTQDALMFGEIAVNYAKGYETISIKNNESGITTFSSDNALAFKKIANPSNSSKVGIVNSLSQYYDTNIGKGAVIEGDGTSTANITASGDYSHAEGYMTTASGNYSHAEGSETDATGEDSHAEGYNSNAGGICSHAEGQSTTASGNRSHAEGFNTKASGYSSHAEGSGAEASAEYSHAEGFNTKASGYSSHAEGSGAEASGTYSHAEGFNTIANNAAEHASGQYNVSSSASTTFGDSGNTLFSVGNGRTFNARHNAFEIRQNGDIYIVKDNADIKLQDALGGGGVTVDSELSKDSVNPVQNKVIANALAFKKVTNPSDSSKVGIVNSLSQYYDTNIGKGAVIEGDGSSSSFTIKASGNYSHAEGYNTKTIGDYSHAEGNSARANGTCSHAEGNNTTASGDYSHAEGFGIIANNAAEHASGQYNVSSSASTTFGDSGNTLFSVGNGRTFNARHNAFEIRQNGDIYIVKDNTNIKLQDVLNGKQDTLVSGTNIKTINNQTLLGSGNITISGGGSVIVDSELLEDSVNPVQNKVITNALNGKADVVAIDGYLHDGAIMPISKVYTLDGLCVTPIVENVSGALGESTTIYFPHFYQESSFEEYEKLEFYKFQYNDGRWGELGYHYMGIEDNLPSWVMKQITSKIPTATSGTSGLMSAEDKIALDSLNGAITSKADTTAVTQVNNALTAHTADTNVHVTASEKTSWNNKSNFSGDYNDLTNKPTIPVVPTNVSAFNNDSGYITSNAITGKADTSTVTQVNNALTAHTADTNVHVTSSEKAIWNNKSDFSGNYNDLTNKPTIPSYTAGSGITISNNTISAKIWSGTKADYDALTPKDSDTVYLIYNE